MERDNHLMKLVNGISTSNVLLAQILRTVQQQSQLIHSLLAGISADGSVPIGLVEPESLSRVNAGESKGKQAVDAVPDHAKAIISAARSFCKPFQQRLSILKTLVNCTTTIPIVYPTSSASYPMQNLESDTALMLTARLLSCRNRDVATAFVSRVQLQLNDSPLNSKKGFAEVVRKITRVRYVFRCAGIHQKRVLVPAVHRAIEEGGEGPLC